MLKIVLLTGLLLISFGSQAELYRSVDQEGKVQYSDLPIHNGETHKLHLGKSVPQINLPYATQIAMKNIRLRCTLRRGVVKVVCGGVSY